MCLPCDKCSSTIFQRVLFILNNNSVKKDVSFLVMCGKAQKHKHWQNDVTGINLKLNFTARYRILGYLLKRDLILPVNSLRNFDIVLKEIFIII